LESLNGKITGNTLTADEWNQIPTELQNIIVDMGISLSSGDLDQLGKAIAQIKSDGGYHLESGIADAYVANPIGSQQKPPALTDGFRIIIRPGNANTGASTINVSGLGVKSIVREDGSALAANDLDVGRDAVLRFDDAADKWFLNFGSLLQSAPDFNTPRGYIDGLISSNSVVDVDHDIVFGPGVARDATNTKTITNSADTTKQLDSTWAVGDAAGGRSEGVALSTDTWYHLFALAKASNGAADFGFDTSTTAANLAIDTAVVAAGFDRFRRIGAVLTDSSSNIFAYFQFGDEFAWEKVALDFDSVNQADVTTAHVVRSPLGIRAKWKGTVVFQTGQAQRFLIFGVGDTVDITTPTNPLHDQNVLDFNNVMQNTIEIYTNLSSQIKKKHPTHDTITRWKGVGHGWLDPRGKDVS